jgi:ubiquinone/menaquinone biosynthesis C-methylase UbiE
VDATCGNGRDTLVLAQLVGPTGRVLACDIQEGAVTETRSRLFKAGCLGQVNLMVAGHERLAEFVREPLRAAVFNLGYLPGGDREIVTRPEETVAALEQAAALLLPGGIVTVCIYTGHAGARDEEQGVTAWLAKLAPELFTVWVSRQLNRPSTAPYFVLVEKSHRQPTRRNQEDFDTRKER